MSIEDVKGYGDLKLFVISIKLLIYQQIKFVKNIPSIIINTIALLILYLIKIFVKPFLTTIIILLYIF